MKRGTKIAAFGAGEALHSLCRQYSGLSRNLFCAVDNFKTGTIAIDGRQVPVVRADQLKWEESQLFIVTSMKYADEWIRQLDQMPEYNGTEFYFPALFIVEDNCHISSCSDGKQVIPKTIHYCWFGKNELPRKFQDNIDTWKKHCPDYAIICWNETNYDVSKNLYMKQAYEAKRWGFVPDYARLDILHTCGGIYLDTDVELLRPLDDLLQFKFFCGFECIDSVNLGQGFGSQKEHWLLKEMMSVYEQVEFIRPDGSFNLTASPKYQTQTLEKYGLIKSGQTQQSEDFVVLSPEYLCPISEYGEGQPTARSFSIHQYAATWFDASQFAYKEQIMHNHKLVLSRMEHRS